MSTAFTCAFCGTLTAKPAGSVNRARAAGLRLFCGRKCSGLGRRKHKTAAQKVAEKREYDALYRAKHADRIRRSKAEYFRRTYNPTVAAAERKTRAPAHAEYCRRPEYREWKREYDAKRRASVYGPYADAYRLLLALDREIESRMSRYEIGLANGTICKAQNRRREYERLVRS